jgi:hypothetical protein
MSYGSILLQDAVGTTAWWRATGQALDKFQLYG